MLINKIDNTFKKKKKSHFVGTYHHRTGALLNQVAKFVWMECHSVKDYYFFIKLVVLLVLPYVVMKLNSDFCIILKKYVSYCQCFFVL